MKAIYINPTQHFEAIVAGEPQALVSIGVWPGPKGSSLVLSFETTQGEEPNDSSRFQICIADAEELMIAIRKAIKG